MPNIIDALVLVLARELHGLCKFELTQAHYETIVRALLREVVDVYWGKEVGPSERSKNA